MGKQQVEGSNDDYMEEEDAIPAATYEPSDSSKDIQAQVNRVMGRLNLLKKGTTSG